MSDTYLDTIHEETEKVRMAAYKLQTLSEAFYATGNTSVGETLSVMSERLFLASEKINGAVGKEINDKYQTAEQNTMTTVAACLAMTKMQDT